jgi:hypothetical protein
VEGGIDERMERSAGACLANTSMTVTKLDWRRGFDRAVLCVAVSVYTEREIKQYGTLTRQTIVPQRLHPPTISRAQSPTLPVPPTPPPASRKYQSAARALYLKVCSGSTSTSSFTQCRVEARSCVRNWSRFARIWRHVFARASRVFKSMSEAIEMTILRLTPSVLHRAKQIQATSMRKVALINVIGEGKNSRITSQCLRDHISIRVGPGLLYFFLLSFIPRHSFLPLHTPQFAMPQRGISIPHVPVWSPIASLAFWGLCLLLQINKDCHG